MHYSLSKYRDQFCWLWNYEEKCENYTTKCSFLIKLEVYCDCDINALLIFRVVMMNHGKKKIIL
jgi:hypothetical protein